MLLLHKITQHNKFYIGNEPGFPKPEHFGPTDSMNEINEFKTQEERLILISNHLNQLFAWRSRAESASEKEFVIGIIDHVAKAKSEIERNSQSHEETFYYYCVNAYVKVW